MWVSQGTKKAERMFEILGYAILFLFVSVGAVFVYFYNQRHSSNRSMKLKPKNYHKKENKVVHQRNKNFDWDMYEDDLEDPEKKFIGLDIWEKIDTAQFRMNELKEALGNDDKIYFNLIEILLLIQMVGDQIKINHKGEFLIEKKHLTNFLFGLEVDGNLIRDILILKDNYFTKHIEIDAKELFYILQNAKHLGLNNIENSRHFFVFVNNIKKGQTIDANIVNQN
jgi:hypothetical protein